MKRLLYLSLAALMVLAVSCKKDGPKIKYGVDGVTSLPEAIDLGLSVKWASFNLGASKPEEYGDYYAWGELERKSDYFESTYTFNDNPDVLPLSADVANKKLGDGWRMPTKEDFNELINLKNNPDYKWEQDVFENGLYGLRITRIPTGASLFFPAAGMMGGAGYRDGGEKGNYWSSSIDVGGTARLLFFYEHNIYSTQCSVARESRFAGCSIRPVWEE